MNRKTVIAALNEAAQTMSDQGNYKSSENLNDLTRRIALSQTGQEKRRIVECMIQYANELDDRGEDRLASEITVVASALADMDFDEPANPPAPTLDITSDEALDKIMESISKIRDNIFDHLSQHHAHPYNKQKNGLHAFLEVTHGHDADCDHYIQRKLDEQN